MDEEILEWLDLDEDVLEASEEGCLVVYMVHSEVDTQGFSSHPHHDGDFGNDHGHHIGKHSHSPNHFGYHDNHHSR